jgi:hypothetical protein
MQNFRFRVKEYAIQERFSTYEWDVLDDSARARDMQHNNNPSVEISAAARAILVEDGIRP